MSTIVTRAGKGSPLTHTEVDNNFTNLNTDKYQSGDNASFGTLASSGTTTLNGTTIPASKTLVVTTDIGSTVQAYDADTAKLDVSQNWSAAQSFNAGVTLGDASGDALTINSSAVSIPNGLNFDSNTFVIDAANNNVGIGTASPEAKLDARNSTNASIKIASTTTGSPRYLVLSNSADSSNSYIYCAGNSLGVVQETNASDSIVHFSTKNAERMRIDSSGNVKLSTAGTKILNSSGNPILNQTGSVLQVVTYTTNTNFSTASSTPADTQLSATITPSSTTSKILVLVHHADAGKAEHAINGSVRLVRGSTVIFNPSYSIGRDDTATTNFSGGFDFHYLDSPATTSATTYKTQAWTAENTTRFYLGLLSAEHSITLLEIAG